MPALPKKAQAPKKKRQKTVVTPKQARHLRGLGHHLKPKAMLGREGFTENVLAAVEANLEAGELLKVKLQESCPLDRHQAAEVLGEKTAAAVVQVLGRTILLYRPNPDLPEEGRLKLAGLDSSPAPAAHRRTAQKTAPAGRIAKKPRSSSRTAPKNRRPPKKG